jgi:hypothetical protein
MTSNFPIQDHLQLPNLNWKEARPEHLTLWKTSVPRQGVDEELRRSLCRSDIVEGLLKVEISGDIPGVLRTRTIDGLYTS